MTEETPSSDPPPPDIRPFGRSESINNKHDLTVNRLLALPIHKQLDKSVRPYHVPFSGTWVLLVILAIAAFPLASAHSFRDPFTSCPVNTKSTPILDLVSYFIAFALDSLAAIPGCHHVSTHNIHGLAKRLDKTGKIEAGMIPVLVALSGMFAGLTLG